VSPINHKTLWLNATLNSYTQVFFSKNKVMAVLLIAVTFLDPVSGISGLLAVLVSNLLAWWLGFNHQYINEGSYGFNSLLVGLGLSVYYEPSLPFFVLLAIASLITFLLTVSVSGVLSKYGLPYLSIPFLLALWSVLLASRQFEALGISQRGVYFLNELYQKGSHWLINAYHQFNSLPIHESIKIYFKSLGAILFQFNIVSGLLVSLALLIYSRIAFTLSLLGFYAAYGFYQFIEADITELSYSYIGFNFILSGIALGGFFLIPSKHSYLWTVLLVPVLVVLTSSLGNLFTVPQLGIYSLPFNLVVITFLYVVKLRTDHPGLQETDFQTYQPEKNLYEHQVNSQRYRNYHDVAFSLPFYGNWQVSQGPDGAVTHRDAWRDAWDFVVVDEKGKQYKNEGKMLSDYYCYNKPVVSPAVGTVVEMADNVEDNPVGEVNLQQNWGNSLVIKHSEKLFSQISHIKKGSFKVKKGDELKKGQVLAACGNSGRSPQPHLHFQIQQTPQIGSKTLPFPISHYLISNNETLALKSFDFPEENDLVSNVTGNDLLRKAFHFLPGQYLKFTEFDNEQPVGKVIWEVRTDIYNNAYLYCCQSGSKAYFKQDDAQFYFTFFEGKKKTPLYYFFLASYKILLGYYPQITIKDAYPIYLLGSPTIRFIQDFAAPFYQFMQAHYSSKQISTDDNTDLGEITIASESSLAVMGKTLEKVKYEILINSFRISEFKVKIPGQYVTMLCAET
jgi:urea transporter